MHADIVHNILLGLQVSFEPMNLMYCFLGVLTGTMIGVLPGIGPVGAMSILLPATFRVTPVGAIIMLAGIYYGAQYGGSTTSILVNIPGEVSSIVTCLDGYQMARKGRAGAALGISAMGSFIGGTVSIAGLIFVAAPLAKAALCFGPPEYFALVCLGLVLITFLSRGSMYKSLIMGLLGLLLSFVGLDNFTAVRRFTFGINELMDGVNIIPIVVGLFGVAEILENLEGSLARDREIYQTKLKGLLPTLQDWAEAKWAVVRGAVLGFFLGILPGGGAVLSSFVSYALEKKISKHPEKFGTGAIEGVAGPETANNAAAQSSFIPLLSLGIPANVTMAVLFGGLVIHGIQPGPLLMDNHPDLFWGVVISMYVGNLMLLALNLPLIGLWVKLLKVPYFILFPMILLFCLIGVYSVNNTVVDIHIMVIFGIVGYLMRKFDFEAAPLALAFVLGPMLETALRESLQLSGGSIGILFTRPISGSCMVLVAALLFLQISPRLRSRKKESMGEGDPEI